MTRFQLVRGSVFTAVLFLFGFLATAPVIFATDKQGKAEKVSDFMRLSYQEGKRQPRSMDTAIVKFVDKNNKIEVDLIAAVHVADKEYYEELNHIFKRYDAMLYELVADEDVVKSGKITTKKKDHNLLSGFQAGMGEALALDFQLEHIDYGAKNFVHADLSPEEFLRRVSERGDLVQMLYRAIVLGTKKGKEGTDEEMRMQGRLLGSFLVSNTSLALKRFFAKEMIGQMDDSIWLIGGDEGSAIITDRNDAALNVLRREISDGKKKLAIFYGGAHLPEFAKRLRKDFKMKQTDISWVIAWDLTSNRSARKPESEKKQEKR